MPGGQAPLRVNLALQGGGAHGAFTWGVLDRLLEEPDLEVAAITGTSAGALNGAALKAGLLAGGADGARAALDALWGAIGGLGDLRLTTWFRTAFPLAALWGDVAAASSPVSATGLAAQLYSPYAWGDFWRNPLQPIVQEFDFSKVCATSGPDLFISATNVRSGKIRVFAGADITPDVLLASACLPTVFQAVTLTDPATGQPEAYWDGGFTGNPALFPLYQPHLPADILIVSINPLRREALPQTPVEIQDRINEISFNAALLGELRAIAFVKRLIAEGRMPAGAMKDLNIHLIADDALMNSLGAGSKLKPTAGLLAQLKSAGRAAAAAWLARHRGAVGQGSSVDLRGLFG